MKLRNRFFLLLFFLMSSVAFSAPAAAPKKTLYLGFAGNGPGQGAFGHAFILFSQTPGDFYNSVAFQYNIVVPPDYKVSPFNVYKLETFPFKVFKESGFGFINYYTAQNRAVYLFQANLAEDVVNKILEDLEQDKRNRESHPRTDYRLSDSNCVSKAFDAINKYLPPQARLRYVPITDMPTKFLFTGRERIAESIPLSAPLALKHNPLFSKQFYFKADEVKNYERILEQVKKVETLNSVCSIDHGVASLLTSLSSNLKTSSSQSYLHLVRAQFETCATRSVRAGEAYVALMDILRYDAQPGVAAEIDLAISAVSN